MKKIIIASMVALATLGGAFALAQLNNMQIPQNGDPAQSEKLVKVATLNSVRANQEFQRNVEIMQAQLRQVSVLQRQIEEAPEADKAGLRSQLDTALNKINSDNQVMLDSYGYSLTRNYIMVVEKAHIYMYVTPEEAARIEAAEVNSGQ